MVEQKAISLNPSDMTEGGLLDDFTATWTKVSFEMFDYQGKSQPAPALKVTMTMEDGETAEQYWSVGSSKDWIPSKDGKQLVAVGSATGLRKSSNAAILLLSLVNAGFPGEKIGNDASVFEGMVAHHVRVPAPKREGLGGPPRTDNQGRVREATILTVSEVKKLPWEAATGAADAKPKAARKPKAAAAKAEESESSGGGSDDVAAKATAFVMECLAEAGDSGVIKKDLPTMAFKKLAQDPDRNTIVQLVFKDDFLNSGPWTYADGTVKMG